MGFLTRDVRDVLHLRQKADSFNEFVKLLNQNYPSTLSTELIMKDVDSRMPFVRLYDCQTRMTAKTAAGRIVVYREKNGKHEVRNTFERYQLYLGHLASGKDLIDRVIIELPGKTARLRPVVYPIVCPPSFREAMVMEYDHMQGNIEPLPVRS